MSLHGKGARISLFEVRRLPMRTFPMNLLLLEGSALVVFAGQPALIAAIMAMVLFSPAAEHLENSRFAAALGARRPAATQARGGNP